MSISNKKLVRKAVKFSFACVIDGIKNYSPFSFVYFSGCRLLLQIFMSDDFLIRNHTILLSMLQRKSIINLLKYWSKPDGSTPIHVMHLSEKWKQWNSFSDIPMNWRMKLCWMNITKIWTFRKRTRSWIVCYVLNDSSKTIN